MTSQTMVLSSHSGFAPHMHREFSAFREEVRTFRTEMRDGFADILGECAALREEMHRLHEISMAQMRELHAKLIARIALLDEHWNGKSRRNRRP